MKIKHEGITTCIKHLAVSGLSNVSARIKSSYNLKGHRFEMPNVSYTQPLAPILIENLGNDSLAAVCQVI
jgi:hypothetical protein